MSSQSSTEGNFSFAAHLRLWFRFHGSAWSGTAAELLSQLKAGANPLDANQWPDTPEAVFSYIDQNAEALRASGLKIRLQHHDYGPRNISIRWENGMLGSDNVGFVRESAAVSDMLTSASAKPSSESEIESDTEVAIEQDAERGIAEIKQDAESDVEQNAGSQKNAELETEQNGHDRPSTIPSSADVIANDKEQRHRIESSSEEGQSSDWYDIRKSLGGFETGNAIPSQMLHRVVNTGIVLLAVVGVLFLVNWFKPLHSVRSHAPNQNQPASINPTREQGLGTPVAQSGEPSNNANFLPVTDAVPVANRRVETIAAGKREESLKDPNHNQVLDAAGIFRTHFTLPDAATSEAVKRLGSAEVSALLQRAHSGDADAQFLLGVVYEVGHGVEQSCTRAAEWMLKSARQADPRAQYNVGLRYMAGDGVWPLDDEAVRWLQMAAQHGHTDAQYQLANLFAQGRGVPQDMVMAYTWYVIADAAGNGKSKDAIQRLTPTLTSSQIVSVRSKLGSMYAGGTGIPKDYTRAYTWFSLAVAAGDQKSEREKILLAEKMTGQQIAEARERASDWLRKHQKQLR